MLFDKFIYDTQEPKTQSVLWIRPQSGKEVTIEAFIDGKWKIIGGGDPSKYLTKEAFEAFKATYNQTIDGLERRITDLETIINRSSYVITLQKDPSTTGTVSGGGRFITGTSVTVVATPDAQGDYPEFDGWYEGETKVSENASYTFTVSGARTLVAKFKEATPMIVSINPALPLDTGSVVTLALPATEEDVIEHLKAWVDDTPGSYFVTEIQQGKLVLSFEDALIYSIVIDNTGTTLTFTYEYEGAPKVGRLEWI